MYVLNDWRSLTDFKVRLTELRLTRQEPFCCSFEFLFMQSPQAPTEVEGPELDYPSWVHQLFRGPSSHPKPPAPPGL